MVKLKEEVRMLRDGAEGMKDQLGRVSAVLKRVDGQKAQLICTELRQMVEEASDGPDSIELVELYSALADCLGGVLSRPQPRPTSVSNSEQLIEELETSLATLDLEKRRRVGELEKSVRQLTVESY